MNNKDHWYDGGFFDLFVAPNQVGVFRRIGEIVGDGAAFLDVGCGTGRLSFQLAERCSRVDGIDMSERNVKFAASRLARRRCANVTFHHSDALEFLGRGALRYDYAAVSYVLHEMGTGERLKLLRALASAAERVILADYAVPSPGLFSKAFDGLVEFAAGAEHYRNYLSFIRSGGLAGLVAEAGLKIVSRPSPAKRSGQIIVASA